MIIVGVAEANSRSQVKKPDKRGYLPMLKYNDKYSSCRYPSCRVKVAAIVLLVKESCGWLTYSLPCLLSSIQ